MRLTSPATACCRGCATCIVRVLPSGTLFPQELTQYDPWVVREALHNAIVHQDYLRQGRVTVVEFPDRGSDQSTGRFVLAQVARGSNTHGHRHPARPFLAFIVKHVVRKGPGKKSNGRDAGAAGT